MSVVLDIYTHIAQMAVPVGNITPTAYDLTTLPDAVESAMLPCRLLLPMESKGEGRDLSFLALANTARITWHITDLMLWRLSDTGIGLEDIAATLVSYAASYAEVLRANRAFGQAQAHLLSASFRYGSYRYPDSDAGLLFDGVEVQLDIEEVLSG